MQSDMHRVGGGGRGGKGKEGGREWGTPLKIFERVESGKVNFSKFKIQNRSHKLAHNIKQ